jgi:predicted nuclease of restriction endonuclease-like (RecB) superfamily
MGEQRLAAPEGYQAFLGDLKERIRAAQIRAAVSVNRELILLYWQIGRSIQERQETHSWGTQVIDRLSADLRHAFPDMKGFSPRNLRYMRAFAASYPDPDFFQQVAAKLPWGHIMRLLDSVPDAAAREWYARQAIEHGWSRAVLTHQIEGNSYARQGQAQTNFTRTLPPSQSGLAQQVLKPSIGLILCKEQNKVVAEYALRDMSKPIGVSAYQITAALPGDLRGSLPTIEEIEAGLNEASGE